MTQKIPCPTIDVKATGANIQRLRKRRGLEVQDVQDFLGFTSSEEIHCWERGEYLPNVTELYALSALLRVVMNDIVVPGGYGHTAKVMTPWTIPPALRFRQAFVYPGLAT